LRRACRETLRRVCPSFVYDIQKLLAGGLYRSDDISFAHSRTTRAQLQLRKRPVVAAAAGLKVLRKNRDSSIGKPSVCRHWAEVCVRKMCTDLAYFESMAVRNDQL
jgi:hypothetical protein